IVGAHDRQVKSLCRISPIKGEPVKRTPFWIALALVSAAAAFIGGPYFPRAFSIVALDITMDRDRALNEARSVMARDRLGPSGYRQGGGFCPGPPGRTFAGPRGGG